MNQLPDWLTAACDRLRSRDTEPWDADEDMGDEFLRTTTTGELVTAFFNNADTRAAHVQLSWLLMFAARRALPCWQLYCDTTEPIDTVSAIRDWLVDDKPSDWSKFTLPAKPSNRGVRIVDCRECDTGCVADAAALAARFIAEGDPICAVCALSDADAAFDQSPLGSHGDYRKWFIEVALPAAHGLRELTADEQTAFQNYKVDDVIEQRATMPDNRTLAQRAIGFWTRKRRLPR